MERATEASCWTGKVIEFHIAFTCQKDIQILILVESCLYMHVQYRYIYCLIQINIMLGNFVDKPFIKLSKCKFFKWLFSKWLNVLSHFKWPSIQFTQEKNRILEEERTKQAALKEEMRKEKKRKSELINSCYWESLHTIHGHQIINSFISPYLLGKNIFEEASNGIPTRDVGRIEIKFTPRAFPTPVRESQSHLEEEVRCISYRNLEINLRTYLVAACHS